MFPSFLKNRPFLPIATERLTLRPLEEKDAAPMAALANDIRVAEMLTRLPHPYGIEAAHTFITYAQEGIQKGDYACLAVIRRTDQTFLGVVGLEGELGYWLGHEFWGQGYGKEAMKALVHFGFFALQQKELKARTRENNIASRRIFEGLGFQQIGQVDCSSQAYEGKKPALLFSLSRQDFLKHYNEAARPIVWVVAAALLNEKGELLLAERTPAMKMPGVWELPGGKMELGETPEKALIRELKEELNIEVNEEDLEPFSFVSYRYDLFHLVMPIYLCRKWEGALYGAEGQCVEWITYEDLAHKPMPPADIIPAHRLMDALRLSSLNSCKIN